MSAICYYHRDGFIFRRRRAAYVPKEFRQSAKWQIRWVLRWWKEMSSEFSPIENVHLPRFSSLFLRMENKNVITLLLFRSCLVSIFLAGLGMWGFCLFQRAVVKFLPNFWNWRRNNGLEFETSNEGGRGELNFVVLITLVFSGRDKNKEIFFKRWIFIQNTRCFEIRRIPFLFVLIKLDHVDSFEMFHDRITLKWKREIFGTGGTDDVEKLLFCWPDLIISLKKKTQKNELVVLNEITANKKITSSMRK